MKQNKNMKKALAFASVNTKMKLTQIAEKFGVNVKSLYAARSYAKKHYQVGSVVGGLKLTNVGTNSKGERMLRWVATQPTTSRKPMLPGEIPFAEAVKKATADMVNHPAHYKAGGIETIDFIEAKGLNYNLGNVVKYITRSDLKGNRKEDLQKALWYLKRELGVK